MSWVQAAYLEIVRPYAPFGPEAEARTAKAMRAARLRILPEWYLTASLFGSLAFGIVVGVGATVAALASPRLDGALALVVGAGLGAAAFALARLAFLVHPRLLAGARGRRIDADFPSVAILAYALSRGGMQPLDVFRAVAEERDTFGEIAEELALVVRECDWFGADLVTALQETAQTTPSLLLRGFLEGLVTILTSGADPRDYLRRQAQTQLAAGELRMQAEIDQAGLLAETYVSGLLVLPLLLLVVLSVLSAFGGANAALIPLIVFAVIPLGTAAYLLVVETLLPPDPLRVPSAKREASADFGMEVTAPGEAPLPPPRPHGLAGLREEMAARESTTADARGLRRRLVVEHVRRRVAAAWVSFRDKALLKPTEAIELSGIAALVIVIVGALAVWVAGARGRALVVPATSLFLLALLVAALPVSVFHEVRLRRARQVAAALPELLSRLSSFNERGIGPLQAFRLLGRSSSGTLARDLRTLDRDLAWNANLGGALRRLSARVRTLTMTRVCVLLDRASRATGDIRDVLDVAAQDATRIETLRARKRQAMMSYVVVIYVVFGVFLYVVYLVAGLFHGGGGLASAAIAVPSGGGTTAATAADAVGTRLHFFHAVVLQGLCCGAVAGKLGEGHLLSGLKHAAILGSVAWAIFFAGVV